MLPRAGGFQPWLVVVAACLRRGLHAGDPPAHVAGGAEAELDAAGAGLGEGDGGLAGGVEHGVAQAHQLPGLVDVDRVVGVARGGALGVVGAGVDRGVVHLLVAGGAVGAGVVALLVADQLDVVDDGEAVGGELEHDGVAVLQVGRGEALGVGLADAGEGGGQLDLGLGLDLVAVGVGGELGAVVAVELGVALDADDHLVQAVVLRGRGDADGQPLLLVEHLVQVDDLARAVRRDQAQAVGAGSVARHLDLAVLGVRDLAAGLVVQRGDGDGQHLGLAVRQLVVLDHEVGGAVVVAGDGDGIADAGGVAGLQLEVDVVFAGLERRVDPAHLDDLVVGGGELGELAGRDELGRQSGADDLGGAEEDEDREDGLLAVGLVHEEPPLGMPMKKCTGTLSNENPERLVFNQRTTRPHRLSAEPHMRSRFRLGVASAPADERYLGGYWFC